MYARPPNQHNNPMIKLLRNYSMGSNHHHQPQSYRMDDYDMNMNRQKDSHKHSHNNEHYKTVKRHQTPPLLNFLSQINPSLDLVDKKIYHSILKKAIQQASKVASSSKNKSLAKDLTQLAKKISNLSDSNKHCSNKKSSPKVKQLSNLDILNMMLDSSHPEKTLECISDETKFKIQSNDIREYVQGFNKTEGEQTKSEVDSGNILGKREDLKKENLEYVEFYKSKILKVENIK